ncbi:MAG: hypothetical protein IKW90_00700 [Lachnospiraceae bacterium]|nr:hypothetical protein [Lachnospiraceae bacterium]
MGFESVLDLKEPVKGVTRPAFFLDLNIDQILERITKGDRKVLEYFEHFPLDAECENYRHDVYEDIKKNALYDALLEFTADYNEFRDIESKKKSTRIDLQRPVWHFWGMEIYTDSLLKLKKALENADLQSEGLKSLRELLKDYTGASEFCTMAEKSKKLKEALLGLTVIANYENGRIQVFVEDDKESDASSKITVKSNNKDDRSDTDIENNKANSQNAGKDVKEDNDNNDDDEQDLAEYEDFLKQICDVNEKEFVNPFAITDELTSFEQEIVKIVAKRNPEIFKEAEKLFKDKPEFEDNVFSRLADELRFYLSFFEFEQKMIKLGFDFCRPQACENAHGQTGTGGTGGEKAGNSDISAEGLYDLALACVNSEKGKPVISNDFIFEKNELFFVLTGPNQGGKTTFARSLGQLIYFTKIGLDVPAKSAAVPYFSDILTHFSVEESVETGRGKLMEELVRLSPMMKEYKDNAFVVINELFTTAANYDAIIMGQNVLKHFLDEGCHGIYVTHLRELCDIDERIVGLSAQLDENGKQNFKILKKAVDYEGCARNQVEKYELGYESLKERLRNMGI